MTDTFYSGKFQLFYVFFNKKVENLLWEPVIDGAYAADNSVEYPGSTFSILEGKGNFSARHSRRFAAAGGGSAEVSLFGFMYQIW